jgi:hypothetical protein
MKRILWLLSAWVAFAAPASAQNSPTVSLSVSQPTVNEAQGGAAVIVVRRTQGTDNPLRVYYRVSGNARNGVDYEQILGSLEIPIGSADATIDIIPLDDNLREPTERVVVQLRPAAQGSPPYRLGARRTQTVQILDDERPAAARPPAGGRARQTWSPVIVITPPTTNAPSSTP